MVACGMPYEQEMIEDQEVIKTLRNLKCDELAEKYSLFLIDKQRCEYWDNYFNPKIPYQSSFTITIPIKYFAN